MKRSETYKAIAARLGFPFLFEIHHGRKQKQTFDANLQNLAFLLNNARKVHAEAKRIAEADAKGPKRATQGGAAGRASSMSDYLTGTLELHLYRYARSSNPNVKAAGRAAVKEVEQMRDWWDAAYKKWTE